MLTWIKTFRVPKREESSDPNNSTKHAIFSLRSSISLFCLIVKLRKEER